MASTTIERPTVESLPSSAHRVALQRTDQFVGRTTNWLYDHLRFVPRYVPFVLSDALMNRDEFPELEAWRVAPSTLSRRLWRRLTRARVFPLDVWKIKRLQPCLLHSHFGYVAAEDLELAQALGIPWVVSFYGADVYQLGRLEKWRATYRSIFTHVDRVLALGPVMARHLEQLGCPRERIAIHPLGVDVNDLPNTPRRLKRGEPLRLLFAGTFREKKGIRYVIEATALVRRAGGNISLVIVGDVSSKPGDQETKEGVLQLIRQLDLESIVTHHSFLPFRQLIDIALHSHVFVAPSVTAENGDAEGTPFVLQQMMATRMPAIATVHSDIPFLFGEHDSLLVPERNVDAIADRICCYLDDPQRLEIDGTKMYEQVHSLLNIGHCATRLSEVYDELLSLTVKKVVTKPYRHVAL
jgi:colanic acid/amylovoran/stewartan biosynthesis glycosyltransferase WcaL/AmsK/CpsK